MKNWGIVSRQKTVSMKILLRLSKRSGREIFELSCFVWEFLYYLDTHVSQCIDMTTYRLRNRVESVGGVSIMLNRIFLSLGPKGVYVREWL